MLARRATVVAGLALAGLGLAACADGGLDDTYRCVGDGCVCPLTEDQLLCAERAGDAFNPNHVAFTPDFLRWSCADTDGRHGDQRGQEYCEYFALLELPAEVAGGPTPATRVLGRNLGPTSGDPSDLTDGATPPGFHLADLTANQQAELVHLADDAPTQVVGQCVFTSWNSDVDLADIAFPPPPRSCVGTPCFAAGGGDAAGADCAEPGCPEVAGLPVTQDGFRMKFRVNSRRAAVNLALDCGLHAADHCDGILQRCNEDLADCLASADDCWNACESAGGGGSGACDACQAMSTDCDGLEADCQAEDKDCRTYLGRYVAADLSLAEDFTRGCLLNAAVNATAARKSDSTICSAILRTSECGCGLADGSDLPTAISLPDRRGFPLGTWSSPSALPTGCRYVPLRDGSQTLVSCDLDARDALDFQGDLVDRCRSKYGGDVVVHVPVPAANALACTGANATGAHGTCAAQPWLMTAPVLPELEQCRAPRGPR